MTILMNMLAYSGGRSWRQCFEKKVQHFFSRRFFVIEIIKFRGSFLIRKIWKKNKLKNYYYSSIATRNSLLCKTKFYTMGKQPISITVVSYYWPLTSFFFYKKIEFLQIIEIVRYAQSIINISLGHMRLLIFQIPNQLHYII